MTFQLSDDEAKQLLDVLGRMTLSNVESMYSADVNDPEIDITEGCKINREANSLNAWKFIDRLFDRLNKTY